MLSCLAWVQSKLLSAPVSCPTSGSCDTVLSSGYASVFSVPLPLLGSNPVKFHHHLCMTMRPAVGLAIPAKAFVALRSLPSQTSSVSHVTHVPPLHSSNNHTADVVQGV